MKTRGTMFRRTLILALAGMVVVAGPADAGEADELSVCTAEVMPDGNLVVRCTECEPNDEVFAAIETADESTEDTTDTVATDEVQLIGAVSGTADGQGDITLNHPPLADGDFDVTVAGCGPPQVLRLTIPQVDATSPAADGSVAVPPEENLPRTGSSGLPLLRVVLVVVGAGALALFATRRRSRVGRG